jgi:hypothetical protein
VATDFDVSRTVRISGTISDVAFSNPHVVFSLGVKNPDGTLTNWNVEFASPGRTPATQYRARKIALE